MNVIKTQFYFVIFALIRFLGGRGGGCSRNLTPFSTLSLLFRPNPSSVSVLLTKCPPPNAAPLPLISPEKRENGKKLKISHNFFAAASVFIVPLGEFAGT